MPLPVRACSDEELEGYAPIEPAAAAELARRIAEGRAERDAALQEAQEEARSISGQYDDLEDRVEEFCRQMRQALPHGRQQMQSRRSADPRPWHLAPLLGGVS
jgi:regulator of protease activity HflC (stomatin/prohibitin superfamily)